MAIMDELDAYEEIHIPKRYAPWNTDRDFVKKLHQYQNYSLVGHLRLYELWALVEQSAALSSGALIEIGVWKGGSGALIADKALQCGITENVYLCDTFAGVVKSGDKDNIYSDGEHSDTSYHAVSHMIQQQLGLHNTKILQGIFPEETAHLIEDTSFRFAHIDVDVYQSAKDIYEWLWDKMIIGGIIIFDDYGFPNCHGIREFVHEHKADRDKHFIYNVNGHAVMIKIA